MIVYRPFTGRGTHLTSREKHPFEIQVLKGCNLNADGVIWVKDWDDFIEKAKTNMYLKLIRDYFYINKCTFTYARTHPYGMVGLGLKCGKYMDAYPEEEENDANTETVADGQGA